MLCVPSIFKQKFFWQMNWFRFDNIVNNATIINNFNSDNSKIANIKTKYHQIMTTIRNRILRNLDP